MTAALGIRSVSTNMPGRINPIRINPPHPHTGITVVPGGRSYYNRGIAVDPNTHCSEAVGGGSPTSYRPVMARCIARPSQCPMLVNTVQRYQFTGYCSGPADSPRSTVMTPRRSLRVLLKHPISCCFCVGKIPGGKTEGRNGSTGVRVQRTPRGSGRATGDVDPS